MAQQLYEGNYAILNMDVPIDRTVTIPGLNGHQGDNERTVPLAIKQGDSNYPYDMTGKYLALAGTDALGVSKIAGDKDNVEKPKFGYVQFKVPAAFYQALGTFTVAYFEVRSVETDEVISSVNVRFDVLEGNKLQMTTGQSEIFNNLTTTAMEYYYRKIKALMEPASNEADRLSKNIEDEIALADKNGLAVLGKDNTFAGTNNFKVINATQVNDPIMGHVDTYKATGVNGAVAGDDLQATVVRINAHCAIAILSGNITLPPMKGYTPLKVISLPAEAMQGGRIAFNRLTSQNNNQTLMWSFNTGDSGDIWVQRQDNGTDKPDPEYVETAWIMAY